MGAWNDVSFDATYGASRLLDFSPKAVPVG
jgi:hypothetical protein